MEWRRSIFLCPRAAFIFPLLCFRLGQTRVQKTTSLFSLPKDVSLLLNGIHLIMPLITMTSRQCSSFWITFPITASRMDILWVWQVRLARPILLRYSMNTKWNEMRMGAINTRSGGMGMACDQKLYNHIGKTWIFLSESVREAMFVNAWIMFMAWGD